MTARDYATALGIAIILMVLNVGISYVVVGVYAYVIEPGHEDAFYQAAAQEIAPWSSVIAGIPLFYFASKIFANRNPARNGSLFGLSLAGGYGLVDIAILASLGVLISNGQPTTLLFMFILSIGTKALAGYLGGRTGR